VEVQKQRQSAVKLGSRRVAPSLLMAIRAKGRRVTGFTKGEDALFKHMPSSLQEMMMTEGAVFIEQPPRTAHTETDGIPVTGQNPASAIVTANAFMAVLNGK
jgi:putative intracellular protease/amidase